MNIAIMTLDVHFRAPIDNANGHFTITYWLQMSVNVDGAMATAQSHPHTVTVDRDSLQEAQAVAEQIRLEAQNWVKGLDQAEALTQFPDKLEAIARTYEFRPIS